MKKTGRDLILNTIYKLTEFIKKDQNRLRETKKRLKEGSITEARAELSIECTTARIKANKALIKKAQKLVDELSA